MRKFFELQVFKIFMLRVHYELWCSCRSFPVIVVSIVVLYIGVVVLSLCCLCRYRPCSDLIPYLGSLVLVLIFYPYRLFTQIYIIVFQFVKR